MYYLATVIVIFKDLAHPKQGVDTYISCVATRLEFKASTRKQERFIAWVERVTIIFSLN